MATRKGLRRSACMLSAVTMTRRGEIDWLYRGVARFLPQEWHAFRAVHADDDLLGATSG